MNKHSDLTPSTPFIRSYVVVLLAAVLLLVAWLIFPDTFGTQPATPDSKGSLVTSAYLKAELEHQPDNPELILVRARELLKLGNYPDAYEVLTPLLAKQHPDALRLVRQIKFGAWGTLMGENKASLFQQLKADFQALQQHEITAADLSMAQALGFYDWLSAYYAQEGLYIDAAKALLAEGKSPQAMEFLERQISADTLAASVELALVAGEPNRALAWLQRFPEQLPDYYQRLLTLAQMTGRSDITRLPEALFPAEFEGREAWLALAVSSRIGEGDLVGAQQLLDQMLLETPDDEALRRQRWQLLLWQNKADAARYDGLWLLEKTQDTEVYQQLVRDSAARYQYAQLAEVYRLRAQAHPLTIKELGNWNEAYELAGLPEQSELHLSQYGRVHGYTASLLGLEVQLLERIGAFERLRKLYPMFLQVGLKTYTQHQLLATALMLNQEYQSAYHVLAAVADKALIPKGEQQAYWSLLAEMAWRAQDHTGIIRGYGELLALNAATPPERIRYLNARFEHDYAAQLAWSWDDFMQYPDAERVVYLSHLVAKAGNAADIARFEQVMVDYQDNAAAAPAWLTLAQIKLAAGELDSAQQIVSRVLSLNPDYQEAYLTQGWIFIERNDKPALKAFYHRWSHQWAAPDWQLALASAAQTQGYYAQAVFLYQQHLQQMPDNLPALFNLSNALYNAGQLDASWRIRRFIATRLSTQETLPSFIADAVLEQFFGQRVASVDAARRWLNADAETQPTESLIYLARMVAAGEMEMARHLMARRVWREMDLPGWLQLSMAIRNRDTAAQATLLAQLNPDALPVLDHITALENTGNYREALAITATELEQLSLPAQQRKALLEKWYALRRYHYTAVASGVETSTGSELDRAYLNLHWPMAGGQWALALEEQHFKRWDQTREEWQLSANFFGAQSEWRIALSGDDGAISPRMGAALAYQAQPSPYLSWGVELGINETNQQNTQWRLAGQQHRVRVEVAYQPTARERLQAALSLLQYETREGAQTVSGQQFDMRLSEKILSSNPSLEAYVSLTAQQFDTQQTDAQINGQAVVLDSQPFNRVAIGLHASEGEPGVLPVRHRSPAWVVDLSVGYQPDSAQIDQVMRAGMGWRITGDDQLSLGVEYQSAPREGDDSTAFKLDYLRHF